MAPVNEEPGTTSIQVSQETWDRLHALAEERHTSVPSVVERLAQAVPTHEELEQRGEAAKAYLRDQMGIEVTEADEAAGDRLLRHIAARAAA